MYFVVFIVEISRNVIVPYSWVKVNTMMQWIVNNGINRNILLDVFYTQNVVAFANGVPRIDYAPNEHAGWNNQFPNEGWYHCFLVHFYGMYSLNFEIHKAKCFEN